MEVPQKYHLAVPSLTCEDCAFEPTWELPATLVEIVPENPCKVWGVYTRFETDPWFPRTIFPPLPVAFRKILRPEFWQVEIEDCGRGVGKLANGLDDVAQKDGAICFVLILHGAHQMNHLRLCGWGMEATATVSGKEQTLHQKDHTWRILEVLLPELLLSHFGGQDGQSTSIRAHKS